MNRYNSEMSKYYGVKGSGDDKINKTSLSSRMDTVKTQRDGLNRDLIQNFKLQSQTIDVADQGHPRRLPQIETRNIKQSFRHDAASFRNYEFDVGAGLPGVD